MTLKPPRKALRLWQARIIILTLLPAAAFAAFYGFSYWLLLPAAVFAVLGIAISFIYLPLWFKNCRISADGDAIEVEYGIIIKTTHIMPFPRLIYIGSYATPIGRLLGLEGLTLKAARGTLILPELDRTDTARLLDTVK